MLESNRKGFAVMSADLDGISFESESFTDCVRYLHEGYVIARRTPKKCGIAINIRWLPSWYKPIYLRKGREKNIFNLHWSTWSLYRHVTGEIIPTSLPKKPDAKSVTA